MNIITGFTNEEHIIPEYDRDINIGFSGADSYVLNNGMKLAAEISSNNEIKIRDGLLIHQGCAASITKNTYDSIQIANGSQGMQRIDLIVARYKKNENSKVESLELLALQGTPAEANPTAPEYIIGDIQAGDVVADMPLYEVHLEGLNIVEIVPLFNVLMPMSEQQTMLTELNKKYIVDFGSNENGYFQKWSDGTLEMWGSVALTSVAITSHSGVLYNSSAITVNFPVEAASVDTVNPDFANTGGAFAVLRAISLSSFNVYLYADSSQARSGTLAWSAKGKWK
ncbi:hypothetical protein [Faecalicatena contorta]|uniref:hypothetical protein n=1 Tax=Faecalicatena contorta TaxID=39482 RepID=UPI001F2A62B7|nr:hypothetical protein [Faecalicatena contorta]MCF2555744.1 hypothetical protein [Faecalicatena contorta]